MRRPLIIILAVVIGLGAILYFSSGDGLNHDLDVDALVGRQAARDTEQSARQEAEKRDLSLLADKGLGQPVPKHLVAEISSEGSFWFVGKPGSRVGVELPFEPGKLPHPPSTKEPLSTNPGFLGAEACQSCHQEQYETYVETAHYRTSRIADAETISGSFDPPGNVMRTHHPEVFFTMLDHDRGPMQRVSFFDWQFEVPIQLVTGSSKMGESYLYWHGERLYQHNCTYLTSHDSWINSPGYADGDAAYARNIPPGCVECHATYIDFRKYPNHYTPSTLILGISCERCHGPGKEHVDFHTSHRDDAEPRHISVPTNLSRQRQLDVCGQCHAPRKSPKVEGVFQFRPGDRLEDFYEIDHDSQANTQSVHTSNQLARLALSECFQQSEMACSECHDPHRNEQGNNVLFSQRCLECHQTSSCGMSPTLGAQLTENCIDCHMPKRASENLRLETAQATLFPPLRDHYIRIDREATDEYLEQRGEKR